MGVIEIFNENPDSTLYGIKLISSMICDTQGVDLTNPHNLLEFTRTIQRNLLHPCPVLDAAIAFHEARIQNRFHGMTFPTHISPVSMNPNDYLT